MPIKILPCPYCGNKEPELEILPTTDCSQRIVCRECITIGPLIIGEDFEAVRIQAIETWNSLPRRLRWTKEKPTVPGIYWARINDKEPGIICVDVLPEGPLAGKMACYIMRLTEDVLLKDVNKETEMACYIMGLTEDVLLEDVNKETEWAGPIQEPMEK